MVASGSTRSIEHCSASLARPRSAIHFVDAVEELLQRALATPDAGALWPGLPPDLGVRRRDLQQFKYRSLAYTVIGDVLWVVAVVHEQRKPGYWAERSRELG